MTWTPWTSPRTWTSFGTIPSAGMNTDVRDNTTFLKNRMAMGVTQITWPGGAASSNTLAVAHSMGTTPSVVVVSVGSPSDSAGAPTSGLTAWPVLSATAAGTAQFVVQGFTTDGQSPTNGASCDFCWIASV